jgi:hypothetical protein
MMAGVKHYSILKSIQTKTMKKTIKILVAAVLAVGFGSLANAQSASISANATVISELTVTNQANLNFGTVVVGQVKTIDSYLNTATVSTGIALGTSNRGAFTVAAQAGSNVTLEFSLPTTLTGGAGTLPISFSWLNSEDIPVESVTITVEDEGYKIFDPKNSYTFPTGFPTLEAIAGTNSVFVYIGGRVDATGVTAGTYTGTITLSATYN